MKLIVFRTDKKSLSGDAGCLIHFALTQRPLAPIVFDRLSECPFSNGYTNTVFAVPGQWTAKFDSLPHGFITYTNEIPIKPDDFSQDPWCVISNAGFAASLDEELLRETLSRFDADVLSITADPCLLAYQEKMILTTERKIAGCRRLYADSVEPIPIRRDWPHHLFIKNAALKRLLSDDGIVAESFPVFIERCRQLKLSVKSARAGGTVFDLNTQEGLLACLRTHIQATAEKKTASGHESSSTLADGNSSVVSESATLIGKVLIGRNVTVDDQAVIVGPTVIGDNAKVEEAAAINSSIIGANVVVPRNHFVQNRIVLESQDVKAGSQSDAAESCSSRPHFESDPVLNRQYPYRKWPRFSYPTYFKRIADIFGALLVLLLFAPVIPIIAIIIKLDSAGPIFFKDRRQGLNGKSFNCLKFRTMATGADQLQEKFRSVSAVDGPQFKIPDDPRVTPVGRFMRETCIDEIPQFFNVLAGQMSIVGPRPSPEAENTSCPPWRDARLSVKPGITGLWQVHRTRLPMRDFQEWIYYDVKYVRELSLRMDLYTCWRTATMLIKRFFSQF
jgi:lipopolysaccharide/colanic/teichoic acid biosynthesis glycosyltransferase/acetyltransferase-like isoleucine patch superfamily enzyme